MEAATAPGIRAGAECMEGFKMKGLLTVLAALWLVGVALPAAAAEGYTFQVYEVTLTPPPEGPEALDVFCQLEPIEQGDVPRDPPTTVLDATLGEEALLSQLQQLEPRFDYKVALKAEGSAELGKEASGQAVSPAQPVALGGPIVRQLSFVVKIGPPDGDGWCDFQLLATRDRREEGAAGAYVTTTIDSGGLPRKAKMGATYVSLLSEWCARSSVRSPDGKETATRVWPAELVLFVIVPSDVSPQAGGPEEGSVLTSVWSPPPFDWMGSQPQPLYQQWECTAATCEVVSPPEGNQHYPLYSSLTNSTKHSIKMHRFAPGDLGFAWRFTHLNTCDGASADWIFGPWGFGTPVCWEYDCGVQNLLSYSYLDRAGGFVVSASTAWKQTVPDEPWNVVQTDSHAFTVER